MKEIFDILDEYGKTDFSARKAALATVVSVEGSSYRQPGARMLITDDGRLTGAISGGCLEGDALRKALLVMARGKPMLVTYDTTDEDDAKLGIGLGCNGIIHILIEPVDPGDPENPVQLLKAITNKRQKAVLITLFSMLSRHDNQFGTCLTYTQHGALTGKLPEPIPGDILVDLSEEVLACNRSLVRSFGMPGAEFTVLAEIVNPVISLVIFGAGNDVLPLVTMAGVLAWQVTLVDGRPFYATCQRFPAVHKVLVADAEKALSDIPIDDQTVFVLMTHNYNYDLAVLQKLIDARVSYIGVLGPKKKLLRMLQELSPQNKPLDNNTLENIYGPVGLDIGAETAEEIALSVVAEIKAVLSGRQGKPLRDKQGTIHSQSPEEKDPGTKSLLVLQD